MVIWGSVFVSRSVGIAGAAAMAVLALACILPLPANASATVFVPVAPCRIIDTRLSASPGPLAPSATYSYKVALTNYAAQGGSASSCGIPPTLSGNNSVAAVALNLVAVAPTGPGDLRMWPSDKAMPTASVVNYAAVSGLNLANGIVVGICQSGCATADIDVRADAHGAYLVVDLAGYFVPGSTALALPYTGAGSDPTATFQATNTGTGNGLVGVTSSAASGVYGNSPSGSGYGVAGRAGSGSGIAAPTHTGTFGDSDTGYGVLGESGSSDGVHGASNSGSGVRGTTAGTSGESGAAGVWGDSSSFFGVWGTSNTNAGVWGDSAGFDGVHGHTSNPGGNTSGVAGFGDGTNNGVFGSSASGNGVFGRSSSGHGAGVWGESFVDGVHGHTNNPFGAFSGVAGFGDGGNNGVFGGSSSGTGVSGTTSSGWGVRGHSDSSDGVHGDSGSGSGAAGISNSGYGVYASSGGSEGLYAVSSSPCDTTTPCPAAVHAVNTTAGNYAPNALEVDGAANLNGRVISTSDDGFYIRSVSPCCLEGLLEVDGGEFVVGDLLVEGSTLAVEPHPADPAKEIDYAALEGPEAGTYFRGTAQLEHGEAAITVPESFRLMTSREALTVQLTPIGRFAELVVISEDLDRIVVQGSADVSFHYLVQGVRAGFERHEAIRDNIHFVPRGERHRLEGPPEVMRRLKANGILNQDGSINLETAARLGWDQRPGWNGDTRTPAPRNP